MTGLITGRRVRLRPAAAADAARFEEILSHPDIARWWADAEEPVAAQVSYLLEPDEGTTTYAVEHDGVVVGIELAFEEADPQYRHAGIDIAVHPDWQGRGLGSDAIRTLAEHLFTVRGHHRVVIDPAADNEAAIRLYRSLGFRPVGTMRAYERGPDGSWHDGLLMDLLAEDLVPVAALSGS
ncbi:GNAT family N-acetyltransferase [Amycolatopsis australiensis]|uniref:Aminoglycoside 6'-N-acetyltransferase n=1 Tax=Amycolatopsis australiensis TaxID=546364 RepID=A0A1K1S8A8_9PSEU|nr:GNAT family protein [Amycolatopsis australiensis]SFW80566.1 aminoglycoside 6'-N-acetyltransferase [Amycolatopsis australiensis]